MAAMTNKQSHDNGILSDDEIKGKFSVINPNFRNTDRSINTTIESTTSDFMTSSGYKTTRTGLKIIKRMGLSMMLAC